MRYLLVFFISLILSSNISLAQEDKTPTKTLTIYSNSSFARDWMQIGHPIKRAFEFECDCKVDLISLSGNSMLSRLFLEGSNSPADIIIGLDMNLLDKAQESGLFGKHNIYLDNKLKLPIEWNNEYFIPYDYGYLSFIYNSKKLKNPPKSFQDLIERSDDELKFIMQDPRNSTVGMSLVAWIRMLYGDEAPKIWQKLKNKIVTVTKSFSESYILFMEGESDILISYSSSPIYHIFSESNHDIKDINFKEGHYLQVELVGKLKTSKNPELADKFLNFVLSRSFQRSIPINTFMFPVIELGPDLPKEYRSLAIPTKSFIATAEEMKNNRNLWIQEWLQALSKN